MTKHQFLTIAACATAALLLPALQARAQFNPGHDCNFCHSMHDPAPTGNYLLNHALVETLCLTCHGPGGSSTLKAEVHTNTAGSSYPAFTMSCMDCHNPHSNQPNAEGGVNLFMIGNDELDASGVAKINTPNSGLREVVFESRGPTFSGPSLHSFADTDEDNDGDLDGVCEVCHTAPGNNHTNTNFTPHHNTGVSCVDCHAHDNFFHGEGDCLSCHVDPQGPRRAVVGEFSRNSHHIGAGVTVEDCEVCHDQSQHQQGNVRLWNVDSPGDTGASIVLGGDPFTSASVADDLETFCLACHDADGANGSAPFSDSIMPPVIDSTLWAAGSHFNDNITCFGDGQFGCHNTGHGSNKNTMLSPGDYTDDGDPDDPFQEEERFCFQCHDSDGPATSDLATLFGQPINWVDQATGLNSNPNLNDRHDVQLTAQAVSGAVIECVNCHNPHEATSGRPYILDPDPNDGRVPGTGQVFAGTDEWSEFCMDCHDGTYGPGVVGHTSPTIVDIRTTWASDGMGGRDATGAGLMPGTQWEAVSDTGGENTIMECWTCHSPHPVIDSDTGNTNHFGIVDRAKDYDNVTDLPGWWERQGGAGWQTSFLYDVSSNAGGANQLVDGGTFCNSCHDRTSMVTKDNCWDCHRHGDGGRW